MISKIKKLTIKIKSTKTAVIIVSVVLVLAFATTAFAVGGVVKTNVECDGKTVTVSSFTDDPYEIIEKAGITVEESDVVELEEFDKKSEDSVIRVKKAHEVIIFDEDESPIRTCVAGTVEQVLDMAGIKLGKYDSVNESKDSLITKDMFIVVSRAVKVKVIADGKEKSYKTAKNTVSQFLESVNIKLGKHDKVSPSLDSKIKENMTIRIKRVEYKTVEKEETIEYQTVTMKTDELFLGHTETLQKGVNGKQKAYYKQKYVDGELVSEKLIKTEVTKNPIFAFCLKGTKVRPLSETGYMTAKNGVISELAPTVDIELDENGRPKKYKKLITGKATAYCTGTTTATGQRAMPGRVAVNPKQIPYGTKMYIVSADGKYVYGYCEASDTGGFARKGTATVDLFMRSYDACIQFGRRTVEIYILE